MSKEKRLGRGLAALLGNSADEAPDTGTKPSATTPVASTEASRPMTPPADLDGEAKSRDVTAVPPAPPVEGDLLQLNVYEIDDNPFQPRRDFSEPEIASLAESLKEHDMLQPVLVRRMGDRFQLISGERRLRAAIQAGWSTIPARLREADDRLVAELAIVENLQRKDLNPIEKALSFKRYLDQHRTTQEELAGRLKIDRSTIANLMRLLELPEVVMAAVRSGKLSAGHARALLPLGDEPLQLEYSRKIQDEGLSVRATEQMVRERIAEEDNDPASANAKRPGRRKAGATQQLVALEQELRLALGTKIEIRQKASGRGQIVVHFNSASEFERIRSTIIDTGGMPLRRSA